MKIQDKKPYKTPALRRYGDVETITQSVLKLGTGDAFMAAHSLPDVLAAS